MSFTGHWNVDEGPGSVPSRRYPVPNRYLLVISLVVIALCVIVLSLILTKDIVDMARYPKPDAIECPGFRGQECRRRGCRYSKAITGPSCTMRRNAFGYRVQQVTTDDDALTIRLESVAEETPYGPSMKNVDFKLTYLTENILRFQFKDVDSKRYEVPAQEEFPLLRQKPSGKSGNLSYEVIHTNQSEVFEFVVKRKEDMTDLWDSTLGALILSERFLQIGSYLPSRNVYGVGEHAHDTLRRSMDYETWPIFAADEPPQEPTTKKNLYGVHPFYTCLEDSGKSHGVLFLNSNAMEVTFLPVPAVSFRTIGGILDFFIFVGDNPEHVVQLYTSLIGRPMMPPYWALGFQLSKYGYKNTEELKTVLNRTQTAKIPQAVQYLDIDHLQDSMDFTYDKKAFEGLPDLISSTRKERDLKWVIIQEPVIAALSDSEHYTSGLEKSVFVKRSADWTPDMFPEGKHTRQKNVTLGKVWPSSYVAFLDFFKNDTQKWWKDRLLEHHKTISYDGLWIDMNEPANFGTNEENPEYCQDTQPCWTLKCPDGPHETPLYNPLLQTGTDKLSRKTICMQSVHGDKDEEYLHYDVHSLYGWSQTRPTLEAAQEATGTRSLVISRSTYPSSGRYAGHWLGDNRSTLGHMRNSIIGMLEFNLFGIPYVGADVCGFDGDATPELCKIWMQLGAFYPYYRNHNGLKSKPQDPGYFEEDVAEASRRAIERRIRLNPYLYTLFYRAHTEGGTAVRPLFHEFPEDEVLHNLATQFMWGKSLMIAPVLSEGEVTVPVYFPKDDWWLFKEIKSPRRRYQERYVIEVDSKEDIPVYVRGGNILPYGSYDWDNYAEKNNTRNITLYVFPKEGKATGELFMDDGISKDTIENKAYALYEFEYSNCTLKVTSNEYDSFNGTRPFLEQVVLFDAAGFANVTGGYETEVNKEYECVAVKVNKNLKDVEEFSWKDSGGKCPE